MTVEQKIEQLETYQRQLQQRIDGNESVGFTLWVGDVIAKLTTVLSELSDLSERADNEHQQTLRDILQALGVKMTLPEADDRAG